jgi:hypothetical protein
MRRYSGSTSSASSRTSMSRTAGVIVTPAPTMPSIVIEVGPISTASDIFPILKANTEAFLRALRPAATPRRHFNFAELATFQNGCNSAISRTTERWSIYKRLTKMHHGTQLAGYYCRHQSIDYANQRRSFDSNYRLDVARYHRENRGHETTRTCISAPLQNRPQPQHGTLLRHVGAANAVRRRFTRAQLGADWDARPSDD